MLALLAKKHMHQATKDLSSFFAAPKSHAIKAFRFTDESHLYEKAAPRLSKRPLNI